MRTVFVQSSLVFVLSVAGAAVGSACFENATIGVEAPDAGSDDCSGANPGCCIEYCDDTPADATCSHGTWTCPTDQSLGPVCDAVCRVRDAGASCQGDNPGCCSTDCSKPAPAATCSADGSWTCPSGDTVGPACALICAVDGGAPTGSCTGSNPGCCSADCSKPAPSATCSADGTWTCPSGDTVGPVCETICAVDGGAPTGSCTGSNPGCCSTDCSKPAPSATCSADGTWTCPSGDTVGPVCETICAVDGGAPTGSCTGSNPGCCSTDCSKPAPSATCSADGTWTCPSGDSVGPVCAPICEVDGGAAPDASASPGHAGT